MFINSNNFRSPRLKAAHIKNKMTKAIMGMSMALLFFSSCDPNRNRATTNNSTDTNNVTKAGGPPIRDTATINKDRRDSAKMPKSKNNGNADPSGEIKNQ